MHRSTNQRLRPVRRVVVAAMLLFIAASAGCQSSPGGSKMFSFNGPTKRASVPETPPGYKAGGASRGKSSSDPFLPTVKIPDGDATASTDGK
jgi:hypothetical protein